MFNFFKKKEEEKDFKKNRTGITSIREVFPESYMDTKQIAEILLKEKKICVFLDNLEQKERRRIIDFLSGILFVYNGKIKRIKKHGYCFSIS